MVGHAQSSLCSGGWVSFMLSHSSPLLPQVPSDRAQAEEEIRRVCEHMCSETVQSGVVTSPLSLSVFLCTHTHTVEAAATEGEEEGGQVSSHCQFSAGSVSCVGTYCTEQVEGESLFCAVTLTVYMYTANSLNPSRQLIQVLIWTEAIKVVVCIVPDSYCMRLP